MRSNKVSFAKYKPVSLKPSTLKHDRLLKEKISKAIKSIRKKYLALKLGKADEDESLNRLFKPVADPLKMLANYPLVKKEEFVEREYKEENGFKKEKEEEVNEANKNILNKYFEQFPPLIKHFIEGYFYKRKDYDETYGVKVDFEMNKLHMGNRELKFGNDSEIIIGDKVYDGSQGLYNLLFKRHPQDYTKKDLSNYKNILQITNAHKRNYDPLEQTAGTRASKYTRIIKPLFEHKNNSTESDSTATSGSGMNLIYNNKPIEYIYWDDVNELIDRLRLLNSSKMAGNTDSHDNEILAIISELREAGIIY